MKTENRMLHTQQRETIILWVINELKERNEWLKNDKRVCEIETTDNTHTWNLAIDTLVLLPSWSNREEREKWKMIGERQHAWISYQTWSSRFLIKNRVRRKVNIHYSPVDVVVSQLFVFPLKHKSSLRHTLSTISLPSPNPLSDIAIRETEQTGNRDHLISWTFIIMLHLKSFAPTVIIIPQPLHASFHYHFLSWSTQNKQHIVIVIIPSCHFASSLHHPHPHHQSLRQDKRAKP